MCDKICIVYRMSVTRGHRVLFADIINFVLRKLFILAPGMQAQNIWDTLCLSHIVRRSQGSRPPPEYSRGHELGLEDPCRACRRRAGCSQSPLWPQTDQRKQSEKHRPMHTATSQPNAARRRTGETKCSDPVTRVVSSEFHQMNICHLYSPPSLREDTTV